MTRICHLRIMGLAATALAAILASTIALPAQQSANRSRPTREGQAWVQVLDCSTPASEGGRLILRADFGSILARSGDSRHVSCVVRLSAYTSNSETALKYFRNFELTIRPQAEGTVVVTARSPSKNHMGADFSLSVPSRYNLDLETEGGNIVVLGLGGDLRAETAGGDIRSGDISGTVRVETQGGNISLGSIGQRLEASTAGGTIRVGDVGGDVNLDTSGGDIVAGKVGGSFRAQTAGGDILLGGATGAVVAETAGGQIQLGNCGATVQAETAAGNIRVQGARGIVRAETAGGSINLFRLQSAVRAQTAAGPILAEIGATRNTFASSNLETTAGDVQVFLPNNLPLDISAVIDEATGHKIQSDFPLNIKGGGDLMFGSRTMRGESSINGGGKPLVIRTTTGNIEIRRLDSEKLQGIKERQEALWHNWQQRQEAQIKQQVEQLDQMQKVELQRMQEQLRQLRERLQQQFRQQDGNDDD